MLCIDQPGQCEAESPYDAPPYRFHFFSLNINETDGKYPMIAWWMVRNRADQLSCTDGKPAEWRNGRLKFRHGSKKPFATNTESKPNNNWQTISSSICVATVNPSPKRNEHPKPMAIGIWLWSKAFDMAIERVEKMKPRWTWIGRETNTSFVDQCSLCFARFRETNCKIAKLHPGQTSSRAFANANATGFH